MSTAWRGPQLNKPHRIFDLEIGLIINVDIKEFFLHCKIQLFEDDFYFFLKVFRAKAQKSMEENATKI